MIQVSNDFKKAIKSTERKIKGYVEVLYDLKSWTDIPTTNITSSYTQISEITDGNRVESLYGSLDYLPLDGSYLAMDTASNTNIGFISDELFENLSTPTITFDWETKEELDGITIYFGNNIPTNLTIQYFGGDSSSETITNEDETLQIIFPTTKSISGFSITFNSMMYSDRKIYVNEIDLGISQVYKNQDLIEFTVDEEVNKLVEEVPINETNITLNNMNDLFNPLNPTGIVPFLSENTLIKPYIGVLTENKGIEYVKMGEFYFDSYTNNSDATTTLVGKNIIRQLETQDLIDDNEDQFFLTLMHENEFNQYLLNYSYNIINDNWARNISTAYIKDRSFLNFLKDTAFYQDNIIYADRDSNIRITDGSKDLKDNISKTELINDAQFKYIDKINLIRIIRPSVISDDPVTSRTIITESITLKKPSEVFTFTTTSPVMLNATVTQTGGTSASIVSQSLFMAFVKVTGTVGEPITITISSTDNRRESTLEYMQEDPNRVKNVILEFNSAIAAFTSSYLNKTNILSRTPSYEMSFEYNGNPSLEAGDYINVETPYGYKPLFIQKNRFKFDGGLEGSIEGVE